MNDKANISCQIFFGDKKIVEPTSAEELEKLLTDICRDFDVVNPLFDIVHDSGNGLVIGIAPKGCFVNYIDKSMDPPYYSSVGNPALSQKDGVVQFYRGGTYESPYELDRMPHESEILKRNLIPFDDMLAVVKSFFQTGERPENIIDWEID